MRKKTFKKFKSHGDGDFQPSDFRGFGHNVIIENGAKIFHPENISIGNNVYVGHNVFLKGYYKNRIYIGDNTWVGQFAFLHGAGGIEIGEFVGIGPYVKILTSFHKDLGIGKPLLFNPLEFRKVIIGDGSDIGIGAIILPGVKVGRGVVIGAGAVVTEDIPDYAVAVGIPARIIRYRC